MKPDWNPTIGKLWGHKYPVLLSFPIRRGDCFFKASALLAGGSSASTVVSSTDRGPTRKKKVDAWTGVTSATKPMQQPELETECGN